MNRLCCALALLLCCATTQADAAATLDIDGRLDEPAWASAEVFGGFRVIQPYTLAEPSYPTEVRMLSTPAGLAFGFTVTHPRSVERQRERTPRDADAPGDRVNVYIDFDADAQVAYVLTVALSGSVQDATLTNENQYSADWDGDWQAAVAEQEDTWTVEYLLPWTMASMRASDAPRREIAVQFDRMLGVVQERSAFAPASFERPRFVSEFHRVEVDQYQSSILRVFPYLTTLRDFVADESDIKTGLDLFWKPSGDFQLTAALNPDFGQVEADELVVNFEVIESFFSDKRPFFTENQALFDLRTPDSGLLIYTRRIGGPRDDAPGRAAEIDAALKLNGTWRGFSYGVLTALESDYADDIGSAFFAQRLLYPSEALTLGYLGTWTDRPFLDRTAEVHAVDATWRPDPTLSIAGQVIATDVDIAGNARYGTGAWATLDLTPSPTWRHAIELVHFDRRLNFNDIGFQRRAGLNELDLETQYTESDYAADSAVRSTTWEAEAVLRRNDSGERLASGVEFGAGSSYRNGARAFAELFLQPSAIDDLVSRGNGDVRIPSRHYIYAEYGTPRLGPWQLEFSAFINQEGIDGTAYQVGADLFYFASDQLNLEFEFLPRTSKDWLIWERDTLFASYARDQIEANLNLNWFPAPEHELRLKLQWLGIDAEEGEAYRIGPDRRLRRSREAIDDFAINNFGLQIRYRWEFRPQSDLYAVYSRGGLSRDERDRLGLDDLLTDVLELRDADQFLLKLRYRF
jgi:hypothetical protein